MENQNQTPEVNNGYSGPPRTILAQVGGYTPVIDSLIPKVGVYGALVFGAIWRYCQMESGRCTASQQTIANRLGIAVSTLKSHIENLIDGGYLRKEVITGKGVIYYDTGKVGLEVTVSAYERPDKKQTEPENNEAETPTQPENSQPGNDLAGKRLPPSRETATKNIIKRASTEKEKKEAAAAAASQGLNDYQAMIIETWKAETGLGINIDRETLQVIEDLKQQGTTAAILTQAITEQRERGDYPVIKLTGIKGWVSGVISRQAMERRKAKTRDDKTDPETYRQGWGEVVDRHNITWAHEMKDPWEKDIEDTPAELPPAWTDPEIAKAEGAQLRAEYGLD